MNSGRVANAGTARRPNIVLIVTDDQRADTLWAMPNVRKYLSRPGIKFRNGYVTNSVCCPSRATILTGNYSHTTGVYQNAGRHGGFRSFDDSSTIATSVGNAGYRTGLFGKYLNQYVKPRYVPPGWDQWHAFIDYDPAVRYYDFHLSDNGTEHAYPRLFGNYATDVLKRKALNFIKNSNRPFFLYFAPHAPHELRNSETAVPAPRHRGAYENVQLQPSPSYDEEDVSDKPAWVQALPRMTGLNNHQGTLESLLAVDEAVAEMVAALREDGELKNTMIIFTSDNGASWGEHRWVEKQDPYRGSAKVPFIVRYDRLIDRSAPREELVTNLDLAPTFGDAANVDPAADVDGASFLPLLRTRSADWRSDFLVEHLEKKGIPSYCGVRSVE